VEQQSSPWRVFDAPSGGQGAVSGPRGGADPAPGTSGFAGQRLAILAIGAAILIGALAIVVALGGEGAPAADGPESTFGGSSRPDSGAGELVIDITGAVVAPGVYRLEPGARIGDAIDVAGGFSPRVDAERVAAVLNLAATLTDGQQVRVPSRDDDAPVTGGGSASGGSGDAGGSGTAGRSSSLIDLNRATQAELESLPGIGPVTAGKIIEARTQAPFRTIDDLRERGLVGQKTFDSLRTLITVS
jgi:competence protein ComEA